MKIVVISAVPGLKTNYLLNIEMLNDNTKFFKKFTYCQIGLQTYQTIPNYV